MPARRMRILASAAEALTEYRRDGGEAAEAFFGTIEPSL